MLEYIVGGLTVVVIILGGIAWIYRKGKKDGIDNACAKRIEEKIDAIGLEVKENREHDDEIHGKLFDAVKDVKNLLIAHLDK